MGRKKGSKNKNTLLGDQIKEVTKAVGVKPCEGCNKRAEALNNTHLKFKRLFSNGKQLTEEELNEWNKFTNRDNKNKVSKEEQKMIVKVLKNNLYMSVKPCTNCSPKQWNHWIGLIDAFVNKD